MRLVSVERGLYWELVEDHDLVGIYVWKTLRKAVHVDGRVWRWMGSRNPPKSVRSEMPPEALAAIYGAIVNGWLN